MIQKMLVLLLFFFSKGLIAAVLQTVNVEESAHKITVVCRIQGSFKHKTMVLTAPNRLVLDLENTRTQVNVTRLVTGRGLIQNVRRGQPNPHTLRLVFDVKGAVVAKTVSQHNGLTLVLTPKSSIASTPKPTHHTLRNIIVVLDPGHGGKDPGARGPRGVLEKNVVLTIAKRLKQEIDRQPGMHAVLTREGDYYIGLRKRLAIARRHNADVFVAIHADAFNNPRSHGASVFALSQRGASSEAARWLAEKENYSELGGVNLSRLGDQSGMIRTVLIDLSQTATIGASLQMGGRVLQSLGQLTSLHNQHVEQARFVVLKSPDIPSILVETGFISNPYEASNLTNPYYQTRLTQALFRGLKSYFWAHPPSGTLVEAMTQDKSRWASRSL